MVTLCKVTLLQLLTTTIKSTLLPTKTVLFTVNLSSNFKTFVLLLAVKVLFPVSLVVKLTVFTNVPFTKVLNVIVKFALWL